ncbi:MAG TPA: hypothetical protein VGD22_06185, partial [Sphingobacteriaceae bacterium]
MNYTILNHIVACPACKKSLEHKGDVYQCVNPECKSSYPVYNHIPVLINPRNNLFEQNDFKIQGDIFFKTYHSRFTRFLKKIQPDITYNNVSKKNYRQIAELLNVERPLRILILGGSVDGEGIHILKEILKVEDTLVETDVSYGPNTTVI